MQTLKVTERQNTKAKSTKEKIESTYTEELVIGLCFPIGSLKSKVVDGLKIELAKYHYEVKILRLSQYILEYYKEEKRLIEGKTPGYTALKHKIDGGNYLRTESESKSILAELAIQTINLERLNSFSINGQIPDSTDIKTRRVCYIIDSLKNQDEILLLRSIYKDLFYLFSIFSPLKERHHILRTQFQLADIEIEELMGKDEFEINDFGQNVRNAFVEADFFIRISKSVSDNEVRKKLKRYLNIIFENEIVTPFDYENAMYVAKSAASNSACLSRQVGASIMAKDGSILSKGWNDVPKFGGNLYIENDTNDHRCFKDGEYCRNDLNKIEVTQDIASKIWKIPQIENLVTKDVELRNSIEKVIRESRIKDLIEFSRSVHAEMNAIIIGSQICGDKIVGSKLFTTTYPCHNCARHIILAGISEVYYIEPYVKSLSIKLHNDAITEDESVQNKVKILLYDGVAPRRYLDFFTKTRKRKDSNGKVVKYKIDTVEPKFRMTLQALNTLEQQAIHSLSEVKIFNK